MTATHVDGLAVIADQPALSAIQTPTGKPIHFKQIRELLLEDESTVYGCVHCDYTGPSVNAVRPHLSKHRDGAKPKKAAARPRLQDLSLAELAKRLESIERVTQDRDHWKARALKAERQLSGLRRTLRGDG